MSTATLASLDGKTGNSLEEFDRMPIGEATDARLFGDVSGMVSAGRYGRRNRENPGYRKLYDEALKIFESALSGSRYGMFRLKEAMGTSDFPLLFGDIIARELLPSYTALRADWRQIFRPGSVPDFRTVKRFAVDGDTSILPAVAQGAPYPASGRTEGKYEYSVGKYGRREPFLWEAIVNDDLDALKDSPTVLSAAAINSEDWFATCLYADANGPDATFFSVGNKNLLSGAGTFLDEVALANAFTLFGEQKDPSGSPIRVTAGVLVVPPSLEIQALKILNATEIRFPNSDGGEIITSNWLRQRLTLQVNPWLPIRSVNATGDPWYLFAAPSPAQRPAGEIGFLRGQAEPQIFMKAPNAIRLGGGMADPMDGDFEIDGVDTKVRHVFGGTLMDPKMAVASQGIQAS